MGSLPWEGQGVEGSQAAEDAGGCWQPPLPYAQGGQRSSPHQSEGLCVTCAPPPGTNRQPATVGFGLSWHGTALRVGVCPASSVGDTDVGMHGG